MTDAVPLAEPEVAVIVAVPLATAVTSPVDETLATDELEDAHVTDAPLIVTPFWSPTVSVSCCVSPSDEKLRIVGESHDGRRNGSFWLGGRPATRQDGEKNGQEGGGTARRRGRCTLTASCNNLARTMERGLRMAVSF